MLQIQLLVRKKKASISCFVYFLICTKGKVLSHFFFLLYLSLLKAPRQLKDIDVESEYPESM